MRQGQRQMNAVSRFVREIPKSLINGTVPAKKAFRYQDDYDYEFSSSPEDIPFTAPKREAEPRRATKFNINDYIKKGSEMGGSAPDYGVGDRVSHVKFGTGTVLSMTERDGDYDVSVEFEKFGVRKLRASFSKLKKI